jgi:hypothetical protein
MKCNYNEGSKKKNMRNISAYKSEAICFVHLFN